MSEIEIEGIKIELYYNVKAMMDIEAECGGEFQNLTDWMGKEDIPTGERIKRTATIIRHMANGAVLKHNQEISFGLKSGEKKPFYDENFFIAMINPNELAEHMSAVYKELAKRTAVSIPDNVKLKAEDEDLAEIEAEKNQKGGDESNVSA